MSRQEISKFDKIIDSRDVIARIEELENERDSIENPDEHVEPGCTALDAWSESDEGQELRVLLALQEEASYSPDWTYGEALIHENYFEDYARELAEDIGAINPKATWPNSHIDWAAAAEELKQDYTEVDFDGETFYIRS